jgi:hypothetical protein
MPDPHPSGSDGLDVAVAVVSVLAIAALPAAALALGGAALLSAWRTTGRK